VVVAGKLPLQRQVAKTLQALMQRSKHYKIN
jgi:hypothetical protein